LLLDAPSALTLVVLDVADPVFDVVGSLNVSW